MTRVFEFEQADWARIRETWCAWWAGELERPLVTIITCDPGTYPQPGYDFLTRFPLDQPVEAVLDTFELDAQTVHYYGDAFPRWWVNFGAGILAAFLGSRVEFTTDTTWFHPLPVASLTDIHPVYDPNNIWWQRVQEITRAAAARWGGRLVIGYTDLGGNLDILASLRGTEKLLVDCIESPQEVTRLTREITALWLRYYDEFESLLPPSQQGRTAWAPPWSPTRGYMLQCDFSYMISPKMFERYVMPDLIACCDALDYPFYHMDGKGQLAHLDLLLSIDKLRGIQWQPGDGQPLADGWLDVLRRIRDGGKRCQVYVTMEGARKIVRELGGKGFLFDIIDYGQTITPGQLETFFNNLDRMSG